MIISVLVGLLFTLSNSWVVHGFGTFTGPLADDEGLSLPFLGVGTSPDDPSGLSWQLALLGLLKLGAVFYLVQNGGMASERSDQQSMSYETEVQQFDLKKFAICCRKDGESGSRPLQQD